MYKDLLLNMPVDPEEDEQHIQRLIDEIEEVNNLLSPKLQELIADLRHHPVSDNVYEDIEEEYSFSERLSDVIATFVGSWNFIGAFGVFMLGWILYNLLAGQKALDPFPFILLNLALSTLAGLQAPVILMSQNRQADKDRAVAQNDYQVNLKSELEIADLHRKVDELTDAVYSQSHLIKALLTARRQELNTTIRYLERISRHDGNS